MEVDAGLTKSVLEEAGKLMSQTFPDIEAFEAEGFMEDNEVWAFVNYVVAVAYNAGLDDGLGRATELEVD